MCKNVEQLISIFNLRNNTKNLNFEKKKFNYEVNKNNYNEIIQLILAFNKNNDVIFENKYIQDIEDCYERYIIEYSKSIKILIKEFINNYNTTIEDYKRERKTIAHLLDSEKPQSYSIELKKIKYETCKKFYTKNKRIVGKMINKIRKEIL